MVEGGRPFLTIAHRMSENDGTLVVRIIHDDVHCNRPDGAANPPLQQKRS